MGEPASRIEVFSLKLEHVKAVDHWINDDDPKDPFLIDSNSCRIFINDGQRMREIYNPVKLEDFYTDLPGFQKRPRHSTIYRPNTSAFPLLTDSMYENLQDYSGGNKRKSVDSTSGPIDLPLITDQYEDIRYYSCFNLIVHQGTDYDLLKKKTEALYMVGVNARPEVYSYGSAVEDLDFDKPTEVTYIGCLFRLTLDCIVFENSRVVTVSVTWLTEEEDIGGVDEKKNHGATKTTTLICGGLYFRSSGCYDKKIVLLNTPDGKAVKVVHGKRIPLLRSVVAVPYDSTFTVEADLCDPNTNSVVQDTATFQTPALDILHKPPHGLLRGNGLNFKVEVTVNNPRVEVFTYKFWE